jgi:hypothetical protein
VRGSRRARATPVLGILLLASACGIPTGGPPETIAPSDVPYGLASPTPTSAAAPPAPPRSDEPRIYLVAPDDALVPRGRVVAQGTLEERLTQLLGDLAEGPSSEELDDQLTTALPPEVSLSLTAVDGDIATIDISTSEDSPSERESRRAVGQIVLTATSLPGIRGILLTRDGEPLEAPLPSGQLTSEPLTAEDYAALLSSPPS